MAQNLEQWYEKLRAWVPSWWFEQERYNVAVFMATAAMFQRVEQDTLDHFNTTFLGQATNPVLDLIASERGITRMAGESDSALVVRIQRITSQTDKTAIKQAVDKLLIVAGCKILEAPQNSPYASRRCFASRDEIECSFKENLFTIVVPKQIHVPYSFVSRLNFASRSNFAGTSTTSTAEYASIITAVNAMKAFGVMYRIVESTKSVVT